MHVSSPSVAHAGSSLVGVGAGPADPERARGPYARSKAAAEQIALAADGPDLAVAAIRPHLVWGPGDQQLVGRVVERARAGRLVLVGTGAALMDSTYVDNAVAALVAAVDRTEAAARPRSGGQQRRAAPGGRAAGRDLRRGRSARPAAAGPGAPWRTPPDWWRRASVALRRAEPPMTRFLAEQLSTAHWFDQRETRARAGLDSRGQPG